MRAAQGLIHVTIDRRFRLQESLNHGKLGFFCGGVCFSRRKLRVRLGELLLIERSSAGLRNMILVAEILDRLRRLICLFADFGETCFEPAGAALGGC